MTKAVLILAGQREGVVDPLCEAADVSHKAEIPVGGIAMLDRVTKALDAAGFSKNIYVSGYSGSEFTETKSGHGPADSVQVGLEQIGQYPCLITTCDHALLTADMVTTFILSLIHI